MYFIIVGLAMLIISVVNIVFNNVLFNLSIWNIVLIVVLSTVAVIAIDGIFATAIRRLLPKRWFLPDNKIYKVSKKEQRFYEKLGIRRWKDKVLELGCFTNFRKNKVQDPNNVEYLERFLLENNYGFIIHIVCCIVGFAIIFLYPLEYALYFGVPVAIVNLVLNLMAAFVLRYNTPKLLTLRKFVLRKQAQSKTEEQEFDNDQTIEQDLGQVKA